MRRFSGTTRAGHFSCRRCMSDLFNAIFSPGPKCAADTSGTVWTSFADSSWPILNVIQGTATLPPLQSIYLLHRHDGLHEKTRPHTGGVWCWPFSTQNVTSALTNAPQLLLWLLRVPEQSLLGRLSRSLLGAWLVHSQVSHARCPASLLRVSRIAGSLGSLTEGVY